MNKLVVERVVVWLFLAFSSSQTQQQMETYIGPQSTKPVPNPQHFQDGNSVDHPLVITKREWVTSLEFSDAYFCVLIIQRSRKYLRFYLHKQMYQFTAVPFGLATAPVPRRLVAQSPMPGNLPTTYPVPLGLDLGWVVKMKKAELILQQDLILSVIGSTY